MRFSRRGETAKNYALSSRAVTNGSLTETTNCTYDIAGQLTPVTECPVVRHGG